MKLSLKLFMTNINMLKNREVEQTQFVKKYYKIKGEEKVFVVLSKNEIVNKFKKEQR